MRERGKVVYADGTVARVRMKASGSCQDCAGKTACKTVDRDQVELEVAHSHSVSEGDLVEIELSPGKTVLSAILLFGSPVGGALMGYWIGIQATRVEAGGVGGSLLGLTVTFTGIWVLYRYVLNKVWFRPKIVKIVYK